MDKRLLKLTIGVFLVVFGLIGIVSITADDKVLDGGVGLLGISDGAGGAGAPTDATYITQTADGDLTNEQAMGALGTGIVKNTTRQVYKVSLLQGLIIQLLPLLKLLPIKLLMIQQTPFMQTLHILIPVMFQGVRLREGVLFMPPVIMPVRIKLR